MNDHKLKIYSRLLRLEKPIGTLLLASPCWWGLSLNDMPIYMHIYYLMLFTLGAVIMRSAGCVYNDLVDKKFDAMVTRTASRPIAAGDVTRLEAILLLCGLLLLGFLILMLMPNQVIYIGVFSLGLVFAYPWMKRITYWPQVFLGITFNIGVLMGGMLTSYFPPISAVLLYIGAIFWTLGYDTVYAYQDIEDDLKIGVKSSAIKVGVDNARMFLLKVYSCAILFWLASGLCLGAALWCYLGILMAAVHFLWQVIKFHPDNKAICWKIFESNWQIGLIIYITIVISKILS